MPKLPASWWDQVFDGKVHHLQPETTPYGTIASLRTSVYREATERGIKVTTSIKRTTKVLQVQAVTGAETVPLIEAQPASTQAVGARPLALLPAEVHQRVKARAEVKAAGLDSLDPDLVDERMYCTCGIGNATEGQRHEPSCGVWG